MFAMGPLELLTLFLISSGGAMPDAVSIFPTRDYFKMRGIETTPAKLIELAGQDPTTPKAQIQQLMALRLLAQERKADPAGMEILRAIAAGRKANDKQGFAQQYAQKALLAMEGKRWMEPESKEKAAAGIAWFPADAALVGAVDFRLARIPGVPAAPAEPVLWRFIPEKEKRQILEKVFEVLESTGNVAIYRGAFAMAPGDKGFDNPRVYTRISGKCNTAWIVDTVKRMTPAAFEEATGPNGEKYHALHIHGDISLALLEEGEFLFVGGPRVRDAKSMLDEVFQVRAGKKDSALKGKISKELFAKIPQNAIGFFAMETPDDVKRQLPLGPDIGVPDKVILFMTPALKALDIQAEGVMGTEENAKAAVKAIFATREEAIQAVKKAGGLAPGLDTGALIKLLESVQVEGKGRSVHVRLLVAEDLMRNAVESIIRTMPVTRPEPPAPPAKEEAPKKGRAA